MSKPIKLSDFLVKDAKSCAQAMNRSIPEQIEYWARLGKAAEENPDLPVQLLRDVLASIEEVQERKLTPFKFG
ncbi:hypothetical protein ICN41_04045 [Polynucleobacter sp. 15G-AUS-farblos]|uniref:ParD-like family protein n=1 Tax=Polynucleobacter sp. 15G-AUS-farblos TaxID=2689094 RepID=UPI001C0C3C50|nr:hypothetical protein [Polynucleobacter sp. 15G-AUS-farblos]